MAHIKIPGLLLADDAILLSTETLKVCRYGSIYLPHMLLGGV